MSFQESYNAFSNSALYYQMFKLIGLVGLPTSRDKMPGADGEKPASSWPG
jgi:hypothetical protein